jgi:hypothetical protein
MQRSTNQHQLTSKGIINMTDLRAKSLAELFADPKYSKEALIASQSTYRRAYHQGYSQAMDDIRNATKPSIYARWANWFDNILTPWRYAPKQYIAPTYKVENE